MDKTILRQKLVDEQKRLTRSIDLKREAAEAGLKEMTDELSMYDQHQADIGTEVYEMEKDAGIREALEKRLEQVEDALKRIDNEDYGVCRTCGKGIEEKRLSSLPDATLCADCARRTDGKGDIGKHLQ